MRRIDETGSRTYRRYRLCLSRRRRLCLRRLSEFGVRVVFVYTRTVDVLRLEGEVERGGTYDSACYVCGGLSALILNSLLLKVGVEGWPYCLVFP